MSEDVEAPPPRKAFIVDPGKIERFNLLPEGEAISYRITRADLGHLLGAFYGLVESVQADHSLLEHAIKRDRDAIAKDLEKYSCGMFKAVDEIQKFVDHVLTAEIGEAGG